MNRARFQRSHQEPLVVPLSEGLMSSLRDGGLDPEAALIEAEETRPEPEEPRELRLELIAPRDALAIWLWTLGLTQREIGRWMGVTQGRIAQRIRVGKAALRKCP